MSAQVSQLGVEVTVLDDRKSVLDTRQSVLDDRRSVTEPDEKVETPVEAPRKTSAAERAAPRSVAERGPVVVAAPEKKAEDADIVEEEQSVLDPRVSVLDNRQSILDNRDSGSPAPTPIAAPAPATAPAAIAASPSTTPSPATPMTPKTPSETAAAALEAAKAMSRRHAIISTPGHSAADKKSDDLPEEELPFARLESGVINDYFEIKEEEEDKIQDIGNVLLWEHINLNVEDSHVADLFYGDCLGLTRDPYRPGGVGTTWINVGRQQIHLPFVADEELEKESRSQVCRGVIGLSVRSDVFEKFQTTFERALKSRSSSHHFEDTKTAISTKKWADFKAKDIFKKFQGATETYYEATCPWGNVYRIHPAQPLQNASLGLNYIDFKCPHGAAKPIARFYTEMLGATAHVTSTDPAVDVARISVGPLQELIFTEIPKSEPQTLPAYDGHHICIYVANFSQTFKKFKARKLIYVNKRFADSASTMEEALDYRTFRFKDIIHTAGRGRLFNLEHEVRSMYHPNFLRPLTNRIDSHNTSGSFS